MLTLATSCIPSDWDLARAVRALSALPVAGLVLHRPPSREERRALAGLRGVKPVAAVFDDGAFGVRDAPLLVVEGGGAGADREASLEDLCRRLHAVRPMRIALRTPAAADAHPAPDEIALVRGAVPHVGYWHDVARGGAAHLDAASGALRGASFHPLTDVDLAGLADALPAGAPACVWCPAGTARAEVDEALRRAAGYW